MWRSVAAGVTVVVAAASGVVTALVTTHPSGGLWVALGVVVIVGAVLQAAVTYSEHRKPLRVVAEDLSGRPVPPSAVASGEGAIAAGGDIPGIASTGNNAIIIQQASASNETKSPGQDEKT